MTRTERMKLFQDVDLYPVITGEFCAGRTAADVCAQVLAGGARIVQLREKKKNKRELLELAQEFRALTARHGALLIINDHVDIALAADADGVHLGQEDLPVAAARRLAPGLIFGVSTHNREEALQAQADAADYINIGPVFPTGTKGVTSGALGPERMRDISRAVSVPFTVMGGINAGTLDAVLRAGARRIAMVTAVTQSDDIAGQVRAFRQRILAPARQL